MSKMYDVIVKRAIPFIGLKYTHESVEQKYVDK